MKDTQYGFVDTGDVAYIPIKNNNTVSDEYGKVMNKIDSIVDGAPEEFDTFKELADEVKSLSERIDNVESTGVEDGVYVKKEELEEYAKRTDLSDYYTRTEIPTVLEEYTKSSMLSDKINSMIEDSLSNIDIEEINKFF